MKMTFEEIKKNEAVNTYIQKADESLIALGYTEHSFAHVTKVAETAAYILRALGYEDRDIELARIAGYLHDIGNLVNRSEHAQSGAVMAFRILDNLGFPPDEIATITTAIGNHDEGTAEPVNHIAAALILADKTDVRRSRVRNADKTG
ncbi:MAG: HD domain-containing protein, partial [Clostridia bacterium]|nr:HD domain-containing protein [Clostridia bacterium]